jgi:DNA-directed RNA polymerase subunit RPC12/RpoP
MSNARAVWVGGRSLSCPHCGHRQFFHGTKVLDILALDRMSDWNDAADVYVCQRCGRVEWFFAVAGSKHEIGHRDTECLACGKEIPPEMTRCPACGWTWEAAENEPGS